MGRGEKQTQLESTKQEVIAQKLEAKKLQSRNTKLEKHIHKFKNECETLKRENFELKSKVAGAMDSENDMDSLQLGKQLQILLQEKAKLQRENHRLVSENNGLQELLSYAMPPGGDPGDLDQGEEEEEEEDFHVQDWEQQAAAA